MDSEELLAQLADIHMPEPVGFWPPAPGWWVLAAILVALTVWASYKLAAVAKFHKIREQALLELDRCYQAYQASRTEDGNMSTLQFVNAANSVFKRVALYHFAASDIASLGGNQWVDFMKRVGSAELLDERMVDALSYGRFRRTIDVDADQFYAFGQQWIASLYRSQGQHERQPAETLSSEASR